MNTPITRDEMNKFRKSSARVLLTGLHPNRRARRSYLYNTSAADKIVQIEFTKDGKQKSIIHEKSSRLRHLSFLK